MLEKLAKQTAVYGISTIVVRFLSYLLTPYYTRVFGQETYGRATAHHAPIPPQTEKQSPDRDEHAVRDAELFARIEYLMQTEGVYRQNDLTIERLAERLDTNRTYISRAINQQAGKAFSSYVNSYRIDEAVRRLSDVDDDTPLKALAQMLGYNHLQTFYTSFQSAIGMPPSKYREKLLKLHREHQL